MRDGKKMIYNAGSMFTEAQWNTRVSEGTEMKKMFPNMIIGNPVDFDTNQTERPTNKAIFELDYAGLTDADYVIFEIDGWDSGTHMEFGLVWEQAKNNPNKYLFPIISDFRYPQGILKGEIPGFGINEMISGGFYYDQLNSGDVPQITVVRSHEQARLAIQAIENGDTKDFRTRFDVKDMYHEEGLYTGF